MTEQQIKEAYDGIFELEEGIRKHNSIILSSIKYAFGDKFHKSVLECLNEVQDLTVYESMEIVIEPKGKEQKEDFGLIKKAWCDQWSVGMEGDSFNGNFYIELPKAIKGGKFLKIPYSC